MTNGLHSLSDFHYTRRILANRHTMDYFIGLVLNNDLYEKCEIVSYHRASSASNYKPNFVQPKTKFRDIIFKYLRKHEKSNENWRERYGILIE